ncbi:MAG TPA: hypothetical protein VFH40_06390 [Gemmatimonadales bacterium]|nr:hypothetical protein [Gemmatimonadales bacterium]
MQKRLAALTLLSLATSCGGGPGPVPTPVRARAAHVLFIGNSLTYTNDLPATVAAVALGFNDTMQVRMVAAPNLALIDHVAGQTDAIQVLQSERWDFVVLQQGPTVLPLYRDTLILATKWLEPYIHAAGGRSAQLMVWPMATKRASFDEVRRSTQLAAKAVAGVFLPAGEAWRAAWSAGSRVALYGADGFHPSPLGTYLTALVIYEGLTGHDVRSLPPRATVAGERLQVPTATVRLLQQVAHETVVRYQSVD